jgi:hypothetical protein
MMRLLASLSLFLIAGLALPSAAISEEKPPVAATAPESPAMSSSPESQDAKALLMRMADVLAKTQGFRATITANYDVVQDNGEKIEFGEVRHVLIQRPDRLRILSDFSNGEKLTIYFDGNDLNVFSPKENMFAKLERKGSVDDMLKYVVLDLQTPVPLAMLFLQSIKEELEKRITEIDYVELTTIAGKPADHLAVRTADTDFQIWLTQGERPLPLRVVITYKKDVGQPQFRADLSDWNLDPKIDESALAFSPPAGAEAVPFMVTLPAKVAAKKTGGSR